MISLIIFIVVLGLVYWAVSLLPLPAPFGTIVQVIFVIIAVFGPIVRFATHALYQDDVGSGALPAKIILAYEA